MTNPDTMLEAGKRIAAISQGRAPTDEPLQAMPEQTEEPSTDEPAGQSDQDAPLTALPKEATIETLNRQVQGDEGT